MTIDMKCFVFGVFAFILPFEANASDWRTIDSKESKLLFSPPRIGNWTPGIRISVNDNAGGRAEWKCWRNFKQPKVNSCITYQSIPGENFVYGSASGIHSVYGKTHFKGTDYEPTGSIFSANSTIGNVKVSFGKLTHPYKKECITFTARWDAGSNVLEGWYCAAEGDTISKNLVYKIIASIGIKGEYEPLTPSSIKQEKIIPNTSLDVSGDKESKLKEAKDLFSQDLINKEEYENLKKKILGLN